MKLLEVQKLFVINGEAAREYLGSNIIVSLYSNWYATSLLNYFKD
jgi:hypothetical protein